MSAPWLSDWAKRIKLTIDHTKVDEDLQNFPVAVVLASGTNAAGVFDELVSVSGTHKIALTTYNGITQRNIEIENWDWDTNEATLWTSLPITYSGTDTILYLYYDSTKPDNTTYIGETGTTAAQQVWDSNFVGVFHLAQDPTGTIKNSTSVGIDASSAGSMTTTDLVDGKVGKAIDFDGSNDYIHTPDANDAFNITDTVTLECIFKPNYVLNAASVPADNIGLVSRHAYPNSTDTYALVINDNGLLHFGTVGGNIQGTTASWSNLEWHYVAGTYNSSGLVGDLFHNNLKETLSSDSYDTMAGGSNYVKIGTHALGTSYFPGIIDEVRISDKVRSDAWIKATYYNNFNQLVTYGSEETPPAYYYDGYITEQSVPVSRAIRLYLRETGVLMDSTTSSGTTGYYYLTTTVSGEHFIVAFDDDAGDVYNALISDRLLPRGIE